MTRENQRMFKQLLLSLGFLFFWLSRSQTPGCPLGEVEQLSKGLGTRIFTPLWKCGCHTEFGPGASWNWWIPARALNLRVAGTQSSGAEPRRTVSLYIKIGYISTASCLLTWCLPFKLTIFFFFLSLPLCLFVSFFLIWPQAGFSQIHINEAPSEY